MVEAEPTLYLHIGRNKVGSTTLQAHFDSHVADLRDNGIDYVFFGQPSPAGSGSPSFVSHHELLAYARGRPGRRVLVSNEGLCCFSPEFTRIMAVDFARIDTRVLLYVRPYREWVLSSYNFEVRTGFNCDDFDDYLARVEAAVGFWPNLEVWGEALGWDKVRVRSLHPADLVGGDLVGDCMAAMGLPGAPARAAGRANVSPSWWAVEVLRLVRGSGPARGWSHADLAVAQVLHHLTDVAVESSGLRCPAVQYTSRAQAERLGGRYNRDLAVLADKTGTRLQPDLVGSLGERDFVPSARHVPKRILRLIRELALAAETARLHPEAAAFVGLPGFRDLCA